MIRNIFIAAVLSLMLFQSTAFAIETQGEVIFRDTLYGAAIGALLGTAIYLADQDDFAQKFGTGVVIGTIGGLVYGAYETNSFVEIKNNEIKLAVPTPIIQIQDDATIYSASLLRSQF